MTSALLDSTVIIHILRKYAPAISWMIPDQDYGITTITWLEVMQGTSSKAHQTRSRVVLDRYVLHPIADVDQQWAMIQLERFQFSHHIRMNDCLIAAVAYRLQIPLYTHNLKDMTPLIGGLAIKPYT